MLLFCSELGTKKGTVSAVRQLAAKRRLEKAQVDVARAADALEEFDRLQRGSQAVTPDGAADGEQMMVRERERDLVQQGPRLGFRVTGLGCNRVEVGDGDGE